MNQDFFLPGVWPPAAVKEPVHYYCKMPWFVETGIMAMKNHELEINKQ